MRKTSLEQIQKDVAEMVETKKRDLLLINKVFENKRLRISKKERNEI